jgi:hypothetical protein
MKVKDLIKLLSEFDPDLDVRIYTDHGQHHMPATNTCLGYAVGSEYMLEGAYDDLDEFIEDTECKKYYTFVSISD